MKNLFLFILFSQVTLFSIAQNSMKNFWQAFNNNQYEEAIKELESFTAANPKDEEGLALLTFMYDSENYPYKAFQSFKKLYAVTSHKTEYIQAFWYTSALNSDSKSTMKERRLFFDEILLNKDIDGSVKSLIHSSIADNYYNMGKFADYWEELAKVKSLNKWQIVGEFENISASGFDKTFGPIENPEQNAKFTNKRKAPIHWFKSEVFQPGQWVRLDYHFIISNSVNYAQTFVNSPIDQEIELRAGVSGSLKAWVNDQLVISEMEEYNNNIDSYRTKIRLKKGWNRVLLQLGTSELSSQNFMVRLTNEKGVDIENITHSNSFQDYPKVGGKDINTKTLEAESFFNDLIKKDPKSIINHILLGRVYLDNGSYDKAHGVIMDLEKLAPKSSIVLWELIKLYSNEDNETDLGACIERIKKEDPMNIFSLSFQFNEAIENENYDKATELLAQLETVSKSEEDIYDKKISLESAKENNQKVIDLAKEAFVKYPENITFLTLKYYIEANVNQNAAAAQKVLKKYLKKNYRSTVQKLYATSFADRNMIPQFLSEYKKLLTVSPYSIGYMLDLSDYYYQTKNFDASIDYLDQAKELAPFIGSIYAKKAKIYADLEKTDDALAQYKKAILYDPTDYTSRDKIREIEEEESPFDVFPEKDYYEIFNNAPSAADFPEDNSILLSQERQIVIHEKGAAEEKYYKLVKVFDF